MDTFKLRRNFYEFGSSFATNNVLSTCEWTRVAHGVGETKIGNGESILFWIGHFIEWNSGKFEHCRFVYPASVLIIMFYCLVFRIKSIRNDLPFDKNVQNYRKSGPILSQFNENDIKVNVFSETHFELVFPLSLLSSAQSTHHILRSVCFCVPSCAAYLRILTLQRGVTSTARHAARSHSFVYISTS